MTEISGYYCPGFVKLLWQSKVQEIREDGRDPHIADIHQLVRKVAVEMNDLVFGQIMDIDSRNREVKENLPREQTGHPID